MKYRAITRSAIADAEQALGDRVNFGEVDLATDACGRGSIRPANVARSIPRGRLVELHIAPG